MAKHGRSGKLLGERSFSPLPDLHFADVQAPPPVPPPEGGVAQMAAVPHDHTSAPGLKSALGEASSTIKPLSRFSTCHMTASSIELNGPILTVGPTARDMA